VEGLALESLSLPLSQPLVESMIEVRCLYGLNPELLLRSSSKQSSSFEIRDLAVPSSSVVVVVVIVVSISPNQEVPSYDL
jgi:hypothetical protein